MNRIPRFILLLALAAIAAPALAGSLTPPGLPAAGSAMPTTAEIYNRLDTGAAIAPPGAFKEPGAGPAAGTGRSLAEIQGKLPVADNVNGLKANEAPLGKTFWGLRTDGTWGGQTGTGTVGHFVPNSACQDHWTGTNCDVCTNGWSGANCDIARHVVNKTGLTTCNNQGEDGCYQYGIDPVIAPTVGTTGAYNTPALTTNSTRFTDNGNGTVTDNQTALIWLKNADCFGLQIWENALTSANTLKGDNSQCSLNDSSTAGQWRLPNINELHSLGLAWPPGSPFTSVQSGYYWSSSTNAYNTSSVWIVNMVSGYMFVGNKGYSLYVWPVRAGQ